MFSGMASEIPDSVPVTTDDAASSGGVVLLSSKSRGDACKLPRHIVLLYVVNPEAFEPIRKFIESYQQVLQILYTINVEFLEENITKDKYHGFVKRQVTGCPLKIQHVFNNCAKFTTNSILSLSFRET